jgi:hypothetical protein
MDETKNGVQLAPAIPYNQPEISGLNAMPLRNS